MFTGRDYLDEAYYAIFQNDFERAIKAFKKALELEPTNATYYYKLSITYSRNKDLKNALDAAKKAYELQPNNQTFRYHLQIIHSKNLLHNAIVNMKKGPLSKEDEKMLNQSKKLDPLNLEAYLLLGIYYGEKDLFNKAINEFNSVLKIEPQNSRAIKLRNYYINLSQEVKKKNE